MKNKRKDAETQKREEKSGASFAPSRLGVFALNESTVEEAALTWLKAIGWRIAHGPDIAPDTLAALRDALLPKLISGELQVADAERIVGEVV